MDCMVPEMSLNKTARTFMNLLRQGTNDFFCIYLLCFVLFVCLFTSLFFIFS